MFEARNADFSAICAAADKRRAARCGDTVTYVVNQHQLHQHLHLWLQVSCEPSRKDGHSLGHRDKPYDIGLEEIASGRARRGRRGATEVCLQGGIKAQLYGQTYRAIAEAVKLPRPACMCTHFPHSRNGATTSNTSLRDYLSSLKEAGLGTLPGTAAEILDDEVRDILCPDKINTAQWLEVMRTAHGIGLKSTATIMFGHVDAYTARHLIPGARPAAHGVTELRASGLRAHGGADLHQGQCAQGTDLPRVGVDACHRPAGARPVHHQYPGVLGEDGARWRRRLPRRMQRHGRRAHERKHCARGWRSPWSGTDRLGPGSADPRLRPHATPAGTTTYGAPSEERIATAMQATALPEPGLAQVTAAE